MKAVVYLFWLFLTAFRIQRWLSILGCAIFVLLLGGALLFPGGNPSWVVQGFAVSALLMLFLAVVVAGSALRALSAPLSSRLLPHVRARTLGALALFFASAIIVFCMSILALSADGPAARAFLFVVIFTAYLTVFTFASFLTSSGQPRSIFLSMLLVIAFLYLLDSGGMERIRGSLTSFTWLVVAATACVWVTFSVWYLRVRRIPPLRAYQPGAKQYAGRQTQLIAPSRIDAMRAVLAFDQRSLAHLLRAAVGLGVFLFLLRFLPGRASRPPLFATALWPFIVMMMSANVVYSRVRQSRLLWLHVGGSRSEVLKIVRTFILRTDVMNLLVLISVATVTMAVLESIVFSAAFVEMAWALAVIASATLYGAYLGLASTRGYTFLVVGFALMAIAQMIILTPPLGSVRLIALMGLQLLSAAVLRTVLVQRWRDIDWLRFRPTLFCSRSPRSFF